MFKNIYNYIYIRVIECFKLNLYLHELHILFCCSQVYLNVLRTQTLFVYNGHQAVISQWNSICCCV